ncbi:MAG: BMP family protein [Solirubrobacteraceae bacterium]
MSKRTFKILLASLLGALVLLVAACGDDDDGAATGDGGTAGSDQLRVALLLPGTVTDQGYNADGKRAGDAIRTELGAEVTLTESVAVPNQADVYRQFANQGHDLVIGWGGQFTDGAVAVAEEFPDTRFLVVNSNAENGRNLASMDTAIEQWQFFAGYVAARLSESGSIAWVGGQCFPATAANLHGTEQGAEYAESGTEVKSTFTGDFEDPTAARQAAAALVEDGADVLTGNLNNGYAGLIDAAQSAGKLPVVTEWTDNSDLAPDVIASSVLKSQARFVVEIARAVQDGTFEGKFYENGLPEDWGPVISDTDLLPDDVYQEALDLQEQVASGEIDVEHDETCPG